MPEWSRRTINVISCAVFRSGTSDSGKAWTIYELTATDMNGQPIDKTLKSFEQIEGDNVEVELQKNDRGYDEYIVRKPGSGGGGKGGSGLGASIDALRTRVEELEAKVATLTGGQRSYSSDIPQDPAPVAAPPAPKPDADDDIPF